MTCSCNKYYVDDIIIKWNEWIWNVRLVISNNKWMMMMIIDINQIDNTYYMNMKIN